MGVPSTGVLSPVVAAAVAANRSLAPGLGWGCLTGGQVRAMLGLRVVLGLPCAADESEAGLAVAIARWQLREGLPPHGRLDTTSWNRMRELFPGLKPPRYVRTRNEVLTTVRWGYDIVVEKGVPTVRLNRIARGVDGGSASFRRTLSQEIAQGSYPTHCFVGSGWGAARAARDCFTETAWARWPCDSPRRGG